LDTSETYIKMADCPEIQEDWIDQEGDWFRFDGKSIGLDIYVVSTVAWHPYTRQEKWRNPRKFNKGNFIWLPRQDQLQAMVDSPPIVMGKLNRLQVFMNEYSPLDGWETMEQLWLAFVMKELHGKALAGDKWIKESKDE